MAAVDGTKTWHPQCSDAIVGNALYRLYVYEHASGQYLLLALMFHDYGGGRKAFGSRGEDENAMSASSRYANNEVSWLSRVGVPLYRRG